MALLTALEQREREQQVRLEPQTLEQALPVWPQAQQELERQQARLVARASGPLAARVLAQLQLPGHGPRGHEQPAREPGRELEELVRPALRWQARAPLRPAQPAVLPLPSRQTPLRPLPQPLDRPRRVWSREPFRLHQQGWSWNASSSR
jgi:hypothetical protein